MPPQPAIVFDDNLGRLGPLTDLRAAFDIRTGARTTLDRLRHELQLDVRALAVPAHLVDLTAERHGGPGAAGATPVLACGDGKGGLPWFAPGLLLVNGRCVAPLREIERLELGQCLVESASGQLIAARPLTREEGEHILRTFSCAAGSFQTTFERPVLLHRPWHVRTFLDDALSTDLVSMASHADEPELRGVMAFGDAPLAIHSTAKVCPGVVFDCENGPVVLDAKCVIRPGAIVVGPAYVGQGSTVMERTLVKAHSSIGPQCKVAGEVGGVVFQGFANKAHDGHLGDAFVGEWSNLGAGTTNSNLLNTYGEVLMRAGHDQPLERTGRQFMGCVIGDHVKTAICTRIMTGVTIGTGAMIAQSGAVTGAVAPFTWATDDTPCGSGKCFRKDKFLEIARAVMGRRKQTLSEAQAQRLCTLAGW
ncbi:MAG TPA: putative sugar nucleotidyl transferase [Phycisphaerales bacterium]|nr:putative sugar nucleotidyl transferase [Phycisphaerales bacterium]